MKKIIVLFMAAGLSFSAVNAQTETKMKCNTTCRKDAKCKADCKSGKCDATCKKGADKKSCCTKKAA